MEVFDPVYNQLFGPTLYLLLITKALRLGAASLQRPPFRGRGFLVVVWVVVSNIFYFHPYLGKISNLTDIFQMGWNHQLAKHLPLLLGCL